MSQMIEISAIEVGERLRAVDADYVTVLAESMRQSGKVLQAIAVRKFFKKGDLHPSYSLMAGAHRLEAAKLAGMTEIPAEVHDNLSDLQARLFEIDENLLRHELNPLDRAVFLAERKSVYEALHPETKNGGDKGNQHTGGKKRQSDTMSFSQDAAEKTGLNPRTIERAVAIARKISPEIRKSLAGTAFSKNQNELLLLAKQEPAQQAKIVDLILREDAGVKSVKAAIARVGGRPTEVPDPALQQLKKLMDAWRHAGAPVRRDFVASLSQGDRAVLSALLAGPDMAEVA
ncbi:ParB/RepB/Spo0J family partition protein [Thalassospira marina]|uniref:Chromosome partitioning protein ParB n=1 Tax=Thalassospira marina TaxID=2048283 RepID=A0ABM6QCD4_9PROT|nr:ParB N-terminal domain-containing protein [Thalassospira marina]AUG53904.1 chromosome partitioning protein ParB [Thalassospira marina]